MNEVTPLVKVLGATLEAGDVLFHNDINMFRELYLDCLDNVSKHPEDYGLTKVMV